MATIIFKEAGADPSKGFRMGGAQSVLVNNVTFTVTGVKFGNYEIVNDDNTVEQTKYASKAQQILISTSVGEDISLGRLLKGRRLVYHADGSAFVIDACSFKAKLIEHMESLGRRADDSMMLNGSTEEVGNHAMKFFKDKTFQVREVPECFGRDAKNKLVPLLSPAVQIHIFE